MKINILEFQSGAEVARGLTVIIDVFRAFSTACYLYQNGAKLIIPVLTTAEAFELRANHPTYLLAGERGGAMIPGFDYGNSPSQVQDCDFSDQTIILTTSNGTLGLCSAHHSTEILTGSFVNARAIANYIRKMQPAEVSLVAMGQHGKHADEDYMLAEYIQALLQDQDFDLGRIREILKTGSGARFFDPAKTHSPQADFDLCLNANYANFIMRFQDGQLIRVNP